MSLTNVLSPISLGPVRIKNRIFRSAHSTAYGSTMGARRIAYHEARARGGVGLTVIEALSVHPSSPLAMPMLNFWSGEENGDGYRRLVDACKPHGMALFQQLYHVGANVAPPDGSPPWSPSDMPGVLTGVVPIRMTKAMIDSVVEGFIDAAVRCAGYGLDGVEIHTAHGYLLGEFLSPNTNKRDDDYGGSFENRTRIVHEIATGIRAAVPNGIAIGLRAGDDLTKGGFRAPDYLRLTRDLQAAGLIDYVSLSVGNYTSIDKMFGGMNQPTGYELPYSEQVSRHVDLPALVIGRFRTLEEADQVIRDGAADMVGMTRAHIADPDIVRKTMEGRALEVRPCIGCNQACVARIAVGAPLGCAVNPAAGFEEELGEDRLIRAETPRTVVVVGGGPAGLEAARVAALRGHKVVLFEARNALGGSLRFAAQAPTRQTIGDILAWLEQEVYRLGVDVRLNSYAETGDVEAESPDVVIVATGSTPRMDGIQLVAPGEPIRGTEQPHVHSSLDILEGAPLGAGRNAVVLDDVGHYEAVAVAEHLLSRGLDVTYVSTKPSFAPDSEWSMMSEPALKRMTPKGLRVHVRTRLTEITRNSVIAVPTYLDSESNMREEIPADLVVLVSHNRPAYDVAEGLAGSAFPVEVIGDALSPRYLQTAIREGHLAGARI